MVVDEFSYTLKEKTIYNHEECAFFEVVEKFSDEIAPGVTRKIQATGEEILSINGCRFISRKMKGSIAIEAVEGKGSLKIFTDGKGVVEGEKTTKIIQ